MSDYTVTGKPGFNSALSSAEIRNEFSSIATAVNSKANKASPAFTGNLTMSSTGGRFIADFSNGTEALRTMFQTSTTNNGTRVGVIPNGTGDLSRVVLYNNSNPDAGSYVHIDIDINKANVYTGANAGGSFLPMAFYSDSVEIMRLTASGTSTAGNNPLLLIGDTTTTDTVSKLQVTGITKQSVYTVATLPAGTDGCSAFVSDATSTTIGSVVTGGGANFVRVFFGATRWRIG